MVPEVQYAPGLNCRVAVKYTQKTLYEGCKYAPKVEVGGGGGEERVSARFILISIHQQMDRYCEKGPFLPTYKVLESSDGFGLEICW